MENINSTDIALINRLLQISDEISDIKDLDIILNRVLTVARQITRADAGSILIQENGTLNFSFIQNDTLSRKSGFESQYAYINKKLLIDRNSLSGYVALTGETLLIDDVYNLDPDDPYRFNREYDLSTDYLTRAVLTAPLKISNDTIIGVIQLLNPLDEKGNIVPFKKEDKIYLHYLMSNAALVIEKAKMTRELILRMIKMAELRDPNETGAHANRVASYSIEIYKKWAMNHGRSMQEIERFQDEFRIAAMLHDVGKVAVSDTILKKPGRLDKREYEIIKLHTIYGARLFNDPAFTWETLAVEVILNHHERWDGKGYPGAIKNIMSPHIVCAKGKKGEEIPLTGRIVALADVYDALISKRVYKDPWPEEEVLRYIFEQKDAQFDAVIVHVFLSIYDIIKAIRQKYQG